MAAHEPDPTPSTERSSNERAAPGVVAPSNRINVALPFARIEVTEASTELAELAAIVADLVELVEAANPGSKVKKVRARAEALSARLQ